MLHCCPIRWMNSVLIFCLNKERKGYCSNKREGFSSFLLKYCVHFLEPQFCSKINWTATYTWILDLAKTVLSYCWNKVNDISYIFFFSANITSTFLWLQVAMIPQVSESIFNVENSVVVPASCIFKNSINKMRIWFLDNSPTFFASTSYVQRTAKTKCEYDSCRHFILLLLQSCLLLLSLVFIFLLQFYSSFPISTFFFIFILILLVQKLNAVFF